MKKQAFLILLLVLFSFSFLLAQTDDAKVGNDTEEVVVGTEQGATDTASEKVEGQDKDETSPTNLFRIYDNSGVYAHFILAVFLLAVFYGLYRFYILYIKEKLDVEAFHLKLKGLVKSGSIKEAINAATLVKRTTLGQVYRIGLFGYRDAKESGKTGESLKEEVQRAFNEAAYQTIPVIDRGLGWFDLLAQVSTYLGLLGTIMGLIEAFGGLGGGNSDSNALTDGIQKSMGTTALGLIGAIIIQFIKGALSARAEKIINEVDEKSVKIMNVINNQIQD